MMRCETGKLPTSEGNEDGGREKETKGDRTREKEAIEGGREG